MHHPHAVTKPKLSVHLMQECASGAAWLDPKKSAGCDGSDYSIVDKASDRNIEHLIHCVSDIRDQGDHPAVEILFCKVFLE